jgi:hypothetical protein
LELLHGGSCGSKLLRKELSELLALRSKRIELDVLQ